MKSSENTVTRLNFVSILSNELQGVKHMHKKIFLFLAGVSVAAACFAELAVVKDGLVYNLDASDLTTITTNSSGNVVEWRAKEGMADMVFRGGTIEGSDKLYYPKYEPSRYSGMGAVRFGLTQDHAGGLSTWMTGAPRNGLMLTNRTVFIVWDILDQNQNYAQLWGEDGNHVHAVWYSVNKRLEGLHFLSGTPSINVSGTTKTRSGSNTYYGSVSGGILHAVADTERIYAKAALGRAYYSYANVETYYDKSKTTGVCTNNYFRGIISQIIVYDRVLTDPETQYMKDMLDRKWSTNAGKTVMWTGAGDGVNWDDPGNWKGGGLPGDGDIAEIGRNDVTVRGDAVCFDLEAANSDITIAPGASLAITNTLKATGDTLFTVRSGGELRVNKSETFSGCSGKGASYDLDGGTLVKTGYGTFLLQHDAAVTGGVLRVERGVVDLNGFDATLDGLTGDESGVIGNSSSDRAVLKLIGGGSRTVDVGITGNVSFQRANGDVVFKNMQRYEGETVLEGVKLTAGTSCVPGSIGGLVMHVDASRPETLVTNGQGQVLRWNSLAGGQNRAFYFQEGDLDTNYKFEWGLTPPVWSATMMNGRPGVGFSEEAYPGMVATNRLMSNCVTTNRTIVAVISTSTTKTTNRALALGPGASNSNPGAWDGSANPGFFGIGSNYDTSYYYNYYVTEQLGGEEEHGDGFASIDGKAVYDPRSGVTASRLAPLNKGRAQLLVITGASSWHGLTVTGSRKGDVYKIWMGKSYTGGVWGGVFSEICIYDRPLTTAERTALESHLMNKWGITPSVEMPAPVDRLSPSSLLCLRSGAVVDLNGFTQNVDSVRCSGGMITNGVFAITRSFESVADAARRLAPLRLGCDIDLTGVDYSMTGARSPSGTILETTGRVSAPFKTAEVPDPQRLRYFTRKVVYAAGGLRLIVR